MFTAINACVLANQNILPAINVCNFGSRQIEYSNCKKCSSAINVCVFDQTAKSANINVA